MKKQYIQPALVQVILAPKNFVTTSILVTDDPLDNVIGDVKEFNNINDISGDVNLWDDVW